MAIGKEVGFDLRDETQSISIQISVTIIDLGLPLHYLPASSPPPSRQPPQPLPLHPHPHPLLHPLRPNRPPLIEPNTRLVPLQHTPLQPPPSHLHCLSRQRLQQRGPVPAAPVRGAHEEILEIDARRGGPGRVVVEIEGHARDMLGVVVHWRWSRRFRFTRRGRGEEQSLRVAFAGIRREGQGGQEGILGGFDLV